MTTVWTGGGVGVTECPKTLMTAFSISMIEGFFAARTLGGTARWDSLSAKSVDAWQVLEQELRKEEQDEQT